MASAAAQAALQGAVAPVAAAGTRQRKGRQTASRASSEIGASLDPSGNVDPSPRAPRGRKSSRLEASAVSQSVGVSLSHQSEGDEQETTEKAAQVLETERHTSVPAEQETRVDAGVDTGRKQRVDLQGLLSHPARPFVVFMILGVVSLGLLWALLTPHSIAHTGLGDEGRVLNAAVKRLEARVEKTTKGLQVQVDVLGKKEEEAYKTLKELTGKLQTQSETVSKDLKLIKEKASAVETTLAKLAAEGAVVSRAEVLELARSVVDDRAAASDGSVLSLDDVRAAARRVVVEELEVFGADRIGKPDYALGTAGGKVVYHSEAIQVHTGGGLLGALRMGLHPNADNLLRPYHGEPGNCLPLKGSNGVVEVALPKTILPAAITLEHVSKLVAYDMSSAPRAFRILGWRRSKATNIAEAAKVIGEFEYQLDGPRAIQTFELKEKSLPVDMIRLQLLSNYGNKDYTCLYRLRVHGTPA